MGCRTVSNVWFSAGKTVSILGSMHCPPRITHKLTSGLAQEATQVTSTSSLFPRAAPTWPGGDARLFLAVFAFGRTAFPLSGSDRRPWHLAAVDGICPNVLTPKIPKIPRIPRIRYYPQTRIRTRDGWTQAPNQDEFCLMQQPFLDRLSQGPGPNGAKLCQLGQVVRRSLHQVFRPPCVHTHR